LSSSFSFSYFSFFVLLSNQNKKKDKEKDKGIPCVMCITNDDAIRNGNKRNNVMKKKKCLKKEGKPKK
jgi:GTP cyclohydrolase II